MKLIASVIIITNAYLQLKDIFFSVYYQFQVGATQASWIIILK